MILIFDFIGNRVEDWWIIRKEWTEGTDERPIEHKTHWWFQDYHEGRRHFDELEKSLGLERERIWSKEGRIVFIVSKGDSQFIEDSEVDWHPGMRVTKDFFDGKTEAKQLEEGSEFTTKGEDDE